MTGRTRNRVVAAVVLIAVVIGVGSATASSHPSSPAVTATGQSAGIGPARQACSQFATLVSDLQAGTVTAQQLGPRLVAVASSASGAATADAATWSKLASDTEALAQAATSNDPATSNDARAVAVDCQVVSTAAPTKS